MLPRAARGASALFGQTIPLLQFCDLFFEIHDERIIATAAQIGSDRRHVKILGLDFPSPFFGVIPNARAFISGRRDLRLTNSEGMVFRCLRPNPYAVVKSRIS